MTIPRINLISACKEKIQPSMGTGSLVGWEGLPYLLDSTGFLPGKVTFEQSIKGSKEYLSEERVFVAKER